MRDRSRRHVVYEQCTKILISKCARHRSLPAQLQMTGGNGIVIGLREILVECFVSCCVDRNVVRWRSIVNIRLKHWVS